eukprot:960690_1
MDEPVTNAFPVAKGDRVPPDERKSKVDTNDSGHHVVGGIREKFAEEKEPDDRSPESGLTDVEVHGGGAKLPVNCVGNSMSGTARVHAQVHPNVRAGYSPSDANAKDDAFAEMDDPEANTFPVVKGNRVPPDERKNKADKNDSDHVVLDIRDEV